ncbi:MAG: hypothetical protein AB1592_11450 [Pseudomonadota bacterium]
MSAKKVEQAKVDEAGVENAAALFLEDASASESGETGDPPAGEQIGVKSSEDKASAPETPPERIVPPAPAGDEGGKDMPPAGEQIGDAEHPTATSSYAWNEIAEQLAIEGGIGGDGIVMTAMLAVESSLFEVFGSAEDYSVAEEAGLLWAYGEGERSALGRYILERGPTAEVLFNKARELGLYQGRTFADLNPAEWASLELAVRVGPAVKAAIDAVLAEADRRHPPPKIPLRRRAVAVEDTIFEQVNGAFERM